MPSFNGQPVNRPASGYSTDRYDNPHTPEIEHRRLSKLYKMAVDEGLYGDRAVVDDDEDDFVIGYIRSGEFGPLSEEANQNLIPWREKYLKEMNDQDNNPSF